VPAAHLILCLEPRGCCGTLWLLAFLGISHARWCAHFIYRRDDAGRHRARVGCCADERQALVRDAMSGPASLMHWHARSIRSQIALPRLAGSRSAITSAVITCVTSGSFKALRLAEIAVRITAVASMALHAAGGGHRADTAPVRSRSSVRSGGDQWGRAAAPALPAVNGGLVGSFGLSPF